MDVKVDTALIKQLRQNRALSQEELAVASGLSLRTVQRIEAEGIASLESKKALAGVFGVDASDLDDTREEKAETARAQQKEVRLGMAGALLGGIMAYAAITYSAVTGHLSAGEAGAYYAIIGAATGFVCMFIGLAAKRRRAHARQALAP